MGRAPCCDKANVKKGPWSPEEDSKLKSYIEQHGTGGNWIALPQKIGLKRCGKSCRLRWLNYLRPNIKHGGFSEEEDNIICSLYVNIGSRWSIIAAQLPGRTDNDIKNYWNTRLKKKLLGKQRKEQVQQAAQAARRGVSSNHLKQDPNHMKRETENFVVPSGGVISQINPYWPLQHSASMPLLANANSIQDFDLISNQTYSLTNLLNEHPYTNINPHEARDFSFPQGGHVYNPTEGVVVSNVNNNSGTICQPSNIFQEFENFPNDLISQLVSVNPQQIDEPILKGFYGIESLDMTCGSTSTNTGSTESTISCSNWNGDMSSLVYSPLVSSDYEGCRQGIIPQDDVAFQESRYFTRMQMQ